MITTKIINTNLFAYHNLTDTSSHYVVRQDRQRISREVHMWLTIIGRDTSHFDCFRTGMQQGIDGRRFGFSHFLQLVSSQFMAMMKCLGRSI